MHNTAGFMDDFIPTVPITATKPRRLLRLTIPSEMAAPALRSLTWAMSMTRQAASRRSPEKTGQIRVPAIPTILRGSFQRFQMHQQWMPENKANMFQDIQTITLQSHSGKRVKMELGRHRKHGKWKNSKARRKCTSWSSV